MKSIWLVYERANVERNRFFVEQWMKAGFEQGVDISLVFYEDLVYGMKDSRVFVSHREGLALPDAAVMRLNQPLLSAQFEKMGVLAFNKAEVARIANDKRLTHQLINGLFPCMDTVFLKGDEEDSPLPYPVVVKAVHSCGGRKVFLAKDREGFLEAVKAAAPDEALVQSCADTRGRDVRVYVLGQDIIATMMRRSDEDFRSNIGQGGSAEPFILQADDLALVKKIIGMFDFGLVGIDFVLHQGKLHFNEIEDAVGTRMLFANGHGDVVSRYLTHILNKLERKK